MEKKKTIIQNLLSYLFLLIKTGMVLGLLLYFICGWPSIRPIYAQSQKNFEIQANEDGSLQGYRIDADGQRAPLKNVFLAIGRKDQIYAVFPPKANGTKIYKFDSRGIGKLYTEEGFVKITYDTSVYRLYVKKGTVYTGWYQKGGNRYYYVKGTGVKGWRKINNKYYYFNSQYVLQRNKIVGTKASGYYYVDSTGIRITAPAVKKAVAFVTAHSKNSQTPRQRLRYCFDALCKYPYRTYDSSIPKANRLPSYAEYMFTNRGGNCYCYASAMAYIAKVLGFESRVAAGGVTAYAGRQLSPHGWCEIKIGSVWKMCDCSMQNAHKNENLYLIERGRYPFRLRCDRIFNLTAKNGKIVWK